MAEGTKRSFGEAYRSRRDEHWLRKGGSTRVGLADFYFAVGRVPDLKQLLDRNKVSGPFVKAFVLVRNESCFWYPLYWFLFFGLLLGMRCSGMKKGGGRCS